MIKLLVIAISCIIFSSNINAQTSLPLVPDRLMPETPDRYVKSVQSGGPGKDGIPSIDKPEFWDAEAANKYLDDDDIVFGVILDGHARAYPQRILVWHEIVNDSIKGKPISITYCPLTATAIGFLRGETELGVSGNLINSNMVMYDRETESYWPQILAVAISGSLKEKALSEHRVFWTTWLKWRKKYPETDVLSTDTGFMRNYKRDPYGQYNPEKGYYETDSDRMFPIMNHDSRLSDKFTVLGFRTSAIAVAIDLSYLREESIIKYTHADDTYTIVYDPELDTGRVYLGNISGDESEISSIVEANQNTNGLTEINAFKSFWFAWAAFYPDTVLLDGRDS